MPVLLNINDDGVLSPNTEQAIAKIFPRRTEIPGGEWGAGGEALPSHFNGVTPAHQWTSPVYNAGSPSLALIRGGIFAGLMGVADFHAALIGDSTGQGFDSGPADMIWRYGWAGQAEVALGAVPGYLVAIPNSRWSGNMVQSAILRDAGLTNATGMSADETLAYEVPHTGGTILVHCAAGGMLTVVVDGGSAQVFSIPAGDGFHEITPTVSGGEVAHTYRVTTPDTIRWHGFRPTYATPRFKFSNFSRSGMTAEAWMPGNRPAGLGHWDGMMAAVQPDAMISALGINQPGNNGAVAGPQVTALWEQIALLDLPSLVITPGGLDLTGTESWFEQYRAQLDAADLYDFPLLDFASVIGTGQDAQARGFMADPIHPNRLGFAYLAAAFVRMLGTAAG